MATPTPQQRNSSKINSSNAEGSGHKSVNLIYPETLNKVNSDGSSLHPAMLEFTAYEHLGVKTTDRSSVFDLSKPNKRTNNVVGSIYLPNIGLERSYDQKYDSDSAPGTLSKVIMAFQKGGGLEGNGLSKAISKFAEGFIGETASELMEDQLHQVLNKNIYTKFEGTPIRQQDFSFMLTPSNENELKTIGAIIDFFKIHSAARTIPAKGGFIAGQADTSSSLSELYGENGKVRNYFREGFDSFMASDRLYVPKLWTIEEKDQRKLKRYIKTFKFGPAFCTSVKINTAVDDFPLAFKNGDPVLITLTLSFLETYPLYGEDIEGLGF